MTDTEGKKKSDGPDAVRIQHLAEAARADLEVFKKLAAEANEVEEKFQVLDRVIIYPSAILLSTAIAIGWYALLYWNGSALTDLKYRNSVALLGAILWLLAMLNIGSIFSAVKSLRLFQWLHRSRIWICLCLFFSASILLFDKHMLVAIVTFLWFAGIAALIRWSYLRYKRARGMIKLFPSQHD